MFRFATSQQYATIDPENEPYQPRPCLQTQNKYLWANVFKQCASTVLSQSGVERRVASATQPELSAVQRYEAGQFTDAEPNAKEPLRTRAFQACVFCAMLHWSETLHREYLTGDRCTISEPKKVADMLSAKWYCDRWPSIPREEVMASAVDFPHPDDDGLSMTSTKVLMHKRRVPEGALRGEVPVCVCSDCRDGLWKAKVHTPRYSLVNDLWLGRHHPLFRLATVGHQLLLALGRVVSTKVYLSSKGADEVARKHKETWRQKFLQYGMFGTAIVFGNGNTDQAMQEYPPQGPELQETFVAVFAGPEAPMGVTLTEEQKLDMARQALRKEVEFQVDKNILDAQARMLKATNYVYRDRATYRSDLVRAYSDQPAVPACFEACAKFVPTNPEKEDMTQAHGPGSSTTSARQEQEAAAADDAEELTKWMSVVDEQQDDVAELTSLPALQGLVERMESQAGRVVANEVAAMMESGGKDALDDIGRARLRQLCTDFRTQCRKMSRDEEVSKLHWRVQYLAENRPPASTEGGPGGAPSAEADSPGQRVTAQQSSSREPQLRVPTTREVQTWWSPEYWSIARPTDFCYGDCVWGLADQPVPLSVIEWERNVLRREEMEYTLPDEKEAYVAKATSRFRDSWYNIHLLSSFWRVTETTKSVHTSMKTPGFFAASRACADISPSMIADVQLRAQQGGKKTTLQSILTDKDVPKQVKAALGTLHQATASLVGSDGHRRQLRGEGEAYTLRFGPPLEFITPNIADTKQRLLLVVQGEEYTFDNDLEVSYREMTQRLARDPVGQSIVFELMIRLFFYHVLGVRPELVGWERGAVRKAAEQWVSDGVAQDWPHVGMFGLVAAAFGPVEAQGRGSLHPHILVWLLQSSMQDVLAVLLRDRDNFKDRLNVWMRQLIRAVVSVQQSAVTELPKQMQGGPNAGGIEIAPLPLGPKERGYFAADGGTEQGTADELGLDAGAPARDLHYYIPGSGDAAHTAAVRPNLPYRNSAGEAVDHAEWAAEYGAASKGLWTKPVSTWASATLPAYRLGEREASVQSAHVAQTHGDDAHVLQRPHGNDGAGDEPLQELRESMPSEEWIRHMCSDARDLVIGCAVHVCSPSCFKYHSKGASHICE